MFAKKGSFPLIRNIYLYLICAISMVIIIISAIGLIRIVLQNYVFDVKDYMYLETPYECNDDVLYYQNSADGLTRVVKPGLTEEVKMQMKQKCTASYDLKYKEQSKNNIKRELVDYIAMLIVAIPLFFFHWRIVRKEA